MTTTTTTAPALLRSVPTTATPSPRAARVTTPGAEETTGERVAMCARAADESAASVEDALRELRALRVDQLAGHRHAAAGRAADLAVRLTAVARVLGELHGELDELAADESPEGA